MEVIVTDRGAAIESAVLLQYRSDVKDAEDDRIQILRTEVPSGMRALTVRLDQQRFGADTAAAVWTAVPTGDPNQCTAANGVTTQAIDPGTYTFSVVLEDTNFINNGGTRSLNVYWYEP